MQRDGGEEEDREVEVTDLVEYSNEAVYDRDNDDNNVFMLIENHLTEVLGEVITSPST